jgi:hypothetical protein
MNQNYHFTNQEPYGSEADQFKHISARFFVLQLQVTQKQPGADHVILHATM